MLQMSQFAKKQTAHMMLGLGSAMLIAAGCATAQPDEPEIRTASVENGVTADVQTTKNAAPIMAGEPTPNESMATGEGASVSEAELAAGDMASAESSADDVITAAVPCRQVTHDSIPVYDGPFSSRVECHFFRGDIFSYFGRVWPSARYVTWCPRGVPPSQGTKAYASPNGHGDGGCG